MILRLSLLLVAAALVACGNGPTDASRTGTDGGPGASHDAGTDADAGTGTDADAGVSCDGWMSGGECRPFTTCETVDVEGTPTSDRVCLTDCELAWSDWGCCSLTGVERTQSRTATVSREASPHGKACPATLTESRPCEAGAPSCDCETATAHYECDREPACEWLSVTTEECRYRPIDCVYSPWSAWSDCTFPCDLGTQTRTRTIVTQAAHGGKPCSDPLTVTQACNRGTRCDCSILTTESQCSSYGGCQWSSGACVTLVESCDLITDETACNASSLCCEFVFGTCVPKTCQ